MLFVTKLIAHTDLALNPFNNIQISDSELFLKYYF